MKRKVFLAFSYKSVADRELADDVQSLINSHDLETVTGKNFGGGDIPENVQDLICKSDALIGLLTRRDQIAEGSWTTHDWVRDEINFARQKGKQVAAVVDHEVNVNGMYKNYEKIIYEPTDKALLFLNISDFFKEWKKKWGRPCDVRLLPDEIAGLALLNASRVSYRTYSNEAGYSEWIEVDAIGRPGGVFVYLKSVNDTAEIQFQIEYENNIFKSKMESQWVKIDLEKEQ